MSRNKLFFSLILFSLSIISCDSVKKVVNNVNLFPVSKDVELGKQLQSQLSKDSEYKIIPRSQAPKAYAMLDNIVETIKSSGRLEHKDDFEWNVKIIQDDILNAFCAPGGYIYVYTGLMKYLDSVDDLAGVMGHEMAHADRRHSTKQMTKAYSTDLLLSVVMKNSSQSKLAQMAKSIVSLKYSRDDEQDADNHSVAYLCKSKYKANGAARFFEKLSASGKSSSSLEEFFSTHPSPYKRVENINEKAKNCNLSPIRGINYKSIVNAL